MDPKERFSSRVDAYAKHRPRYPCEVIDYLLREIGLDPSWTIADIGSGTGISCELFLQNGNKVFGVEPNEPMRKAAETSLAAFADFKSLNGSAESTTLPDNSIDLLIAAQAFHWFDIPAARREFARILKPRGQVLLMWNARQLGGSPFLEAYEHLLLEFGTDYDKVRHDNITSQELRAFFGGDYRSQTFSNQQQFDLAGLKGRFASSSYVPAAGDPRHADAIRKLEQIFHRHQDQGHVVMHYQTELFLGPLIV